MQWPASDSAVVLSCAGSRRMHGGHLRRTQLCVRSGSQILCESWASWMTILPNFKKPMNILSGKTMKMRREIPCEWNSMRKYSKMEGRIRILYKYKKACALPLPSSPLFQKWEWTGKKDWPQIDKSNWVPRQKRVRLRFVACWNYTHQLSRSLKFITLASYSIPQSQEKQEISSNTHVHPHMKMKTKLRNKFICYMSLQESALQHQCTNARLRISDVGCVIES